MIKKLLAIPLIVIIGIVIASFFGILHDQVTYTISPEYYTKFKFSQFGLTSDTNPDNVLALISLTGVIATWWVGLILGIAFGITSLRLKYAKEMIGTSVKAMLLTISITVVMAVAGYIYGRYTLINSDGLMNIYSINDFHSFIIVGSIHTCSYIGGFIGLIIGIFYILRKKNKFDNFIPSPIQHQ